MTLKKTPSIKNSGNNSGQKMIISPIKTQGRKTGLVEQLSLWTDWYSGGMWIEPFMGICQVGLSFAPPDGALMCDTNPYLVKLCVAMQEGTVSRESVRTFMESESRLLHSEGEIHFMRIRDSFNRSHDPHDPLYDSISVTVFNYSKRFRSI